jgi:cell division septation protein DedD
MQKKKLFVQKQSLKAGKRSYISLFLWAAVGLIVLVVVASFATRQKSTEPETMKLIAEKGVLVKEIPRPETPARERFPREGTTDGEGSPEGIGAGTADSVPDFKSFPNSRATAGAGAGAGAGSGALDQNAPQTDEFKTAMESTAPQGTSPSAEKPASKSAEKAGGVAPENAGGSSRKGQIPARDKLPAEGPAANDVKQKNHLASAGPHPADVAPGAPQTPPPAEKPGKLPPQPQSKLMYVIQVGSFKEKQNAEELRQDLVKRGYDVVIKPRNHPKLGPLFVVQLEPVAEESKASTLMTQVGHEAKVKPVLLRVSGEP